MTMNNLTLKRIMVTAVIVITACILASANVSDGDSVAGFTVGDFAYSPDYTLNGVEPISSTFEDGTLNTPYNSANEEIIDDEGWRNLIIIIIVVAIIPVAIIIVVVYKIRSGSPERAIAKLSTIDPRNR